MPRREVAKHKKDESYLKKRAFIAAYETVGTIRGAAKAAQINRASHFDWLRSDEIYRAAFEGAQDDLADTLEGEAIRRARDGVKRPIMYKGRAVKQGRRILYLTEYSDQLLITLLKRFRPALYRENVTTEHTGSIEIIERLQNARKRLIEMRRDDVSATG